MKTLPFLLALLLIGCSDDSSDTPIDPILLQAMAPAGSITVVSGGGQSAVGGSLLMDPFVVLVRDPMGRALANFQVTFTIARGAGRLWPAVAVTDSNGFARTQYQVGLQAGPNVVTAGPRPESQYADPTFTATATQWTAPLMNYSFLRQGSMISATTVFMNLGSTPLYAGRMAIEIRPRGGWTSNPDYRITLDDPVDDYLLQPGETMQFESFHEFNWLGDEPSGPWEAYSVFVDAQGIAHHGTGMEFVVPIR